MYKKVSLGLLMGTFVALTLFICCAQARENEFTADMVERISGKTKMSKIYVKGEKYRLEQEEDGLQIIVIVDQDAGVTRVLLPGEKKYIEMESKDPNILIRQNVQPFGIFKFCDLGHIIDGKPFFYFDFFLEPLARPNSVFKGTYKIKILTSASNSRPTTRWFQIQWTGKWAEEEKDMFSKDCIIIGSTTAET